MPNFKVGGAWKYCTPEEIFWNHIRSVKKDGEKLNATSTLQRGVANNM